MKSISLLTLLFSSTLLFAQHVNNSLEGTFKNKNKESLYGTLVFDGQGKVNINDMKMYEYFERHDSVIIFVDKTTFEFKKEKDRLIGISDWVDQEVFKSNGKMSIATLPKNDHLQQRANWLSQYYDINYQLGTNLLESVTDEADLEKQMNILANENKKLCVQGFDLGCIQQFSHEMMAEMGGISEAFNLDENYRMKPQKKFEDLANRVIELGNPDGYGLLSTYWQLTGDATKAQEMNDKGIEEGCELCIEQYINQMANEIKE